MGSHVVGRPGGSPITGWMHICWVHTLAGLKYGLCMLWVDLGRSHVRTMYVVGRPGQVSTASQVGEWPPALLPIPYYTCWLWKPSYLASQPATCYKVCRCC